MNTASIAESDLSDIFISITEKSKLKEGFETGKAAVEENWKVLIRKHNKRGINEDIRGQFQNPNSMRE